MDGGKEGNMAQLGRTRPLKTTLKLIEDLQGEYNESSSLMKRYMECDLLVLDEFGVRKMTDFVYDRRIKIFDTFYFSLRKRFVELLTFDCGLVENFTKDNLGSGSCNWF